MKTIFNLEQINFIKECYKNFTYEEMSKMLLFKGLFPKQIRNKARSLGIKKTRNFDDKYFKVIDKKEKAYFLGLIYADGYISENIKNRNYELGIELQEEDTYILKKFNKELGGVHNIKKKISNKKFNGYEYTTHTSVCRIYSSQIVRDLKSIGIVKNKTNSDIYPIIEDTYFNHFIRGYFDGDGCIYNSKNNNYNLIHFTSSNESFLKYIMNNISSCIGVQGRIYQEKDKKFRLMYFKKDEVKKLIEYMYTDSEDLRLSRKYKKII